MFPDYEGGAPQPPPPLATSITEDFARALYLLHSPEPGSSEELRDLLDATIARRYGPERTIRARLRRSSAAGPTSAAAPVEQHRQNEGSSVAAAASSSSSSSSSLAAEELRGEAAKQVALGYGNEAEGKDEVPRLSIPEVEQNDDGEVCKVCKVPEFGQLILIQCRKCGELYHPLCHQPPVIDACVNDSNFIWECINCEKRLSYDNSSRNKLRKDSTWIHGDKIKKSSKKSRKRTATNGSSKR